MKSFKKLATHTALLAAFALTLTGCFENQAPDPLHYTF
jgi:predicted small secreted protein